MSGSATLLKTAGDRDRSMSSARKHESRSSSDLMTSATRRRSDATTRSLKRLLNELADDRRRCRKSNEGGLTDDAGQLAIRAAAGLGGSERKGTTHHKSVSDSPERATMLVAISRSRTAEGSYGSWTRDGAPMLIWGELGAEPEPERVRTRSIVTRWTRSKRTWTGATSAPPLRSL